MQKKKRKQAEMRLMDRTRNTKNVQEESEEEHKLSVCKKKAKVNTSSGPHSCDGFSTTSALERAQEVQANLVSEAPSFIKTLLKSQVSGKFDMIMPREFCRLYMPQVNTTNVLLDENGKEFNTKYTVTSGRLCGGWKSFSIAHKLVEGDVLVFQLIEPFKFKVYIVRALENINCRAVINTNTMEDPLLSADYHTPIVEEDSLLSDDYDTRIVEDSLPDNDNRGGSDNMEGIQVSKSIINFKDVKSFEDFSSHLNGLILNTDQISVNLREKYYKLCCSQNIFLHENMTEGCNTILATGMISETINIADAIRAAKSTTSLKHLESWDKTLKAFEDLGMVVGFLRARIHKLISLSNTACSKTNERKKSVQRLKSVKEQLGNLLKSIKGLDAEIKEHDSAFEEVISASW